MLLELTKIAINTKNERIFVIDIQKMNFFDEYFHVPIREINFDKKHFTNKKVRQTGLSFFIISLL
jgi:hypothetical protein